MSTTDIEESKYTADVIADYIIELANQEVPVTGEEVAREGISNLKLQKILYFVQAYFLVTLNRPAFKEDILAWKYGPVVVEIYDKYKNSKSNLIEFAPSLSNGKSVLSQDEQKAIENVWEEFGGYAATALIDITHNHAPWKNASKKGENATIDNSIIKEYYFSSFTAIDELAR